MKKQPLRATAALTLSLTAGAVISAVYTPDVSHAAPRGQQPNQSTLPVITIRSSSTATTRGSSKTTNKSTPSTTPTPNATATPRPTPVPGAGDIRLLEGALSRTLTDTEKSAITTAATTRDAAIKTAMTNLDTQVAAAVGLTVIQLQTALKSYRPTGHPTTPPDPVEVLEDVLDRELTDAEAAAVELAFTTRDAAIKAAMDAYRTSVATALNMSLADLDAAVQAFLDAHKSGPRPGGGQRPGGANGGQGGGRPGNCPPPHGGTNSGDTTAGTTNGGTTGGTGNTSGGYTY